MERKSFPVLCSPPLVVRYRTVLLALSPTCITPASPSFCHSMPVDSIPVLSLFSSPPFFPSASNILVYCYPPVTHPDLETWRASRISNGRGRTMISSPPTPILPDVAPQQPRPNVRKPRRVPEGLLAVASATTILQPRFRLRPALVTTSLHTGEKLLPDRTERRRHSVRHRK